VRTSWYDEAASRKRGGVTETLKPESHKGKISLDQARFFGLDSIFFSKVQMYSK
jgi:hypothetical protein